MSEAERSLHGAFRAASPGWSSPTLARYAYRMRPCNSTAEPPNEGIAIISPRSAAMLPMRRVVSLPPIMMATSDESNAARLGISDHVPPCSRSSSGWNRRLSVT